MQATSQPATVGTLKEVVHYLRLGSYKALRDLRLRQPTEHPLVIPVDHRGHFEISTAELDQWKAREAQLQNERAQARIEAQRAKAS